MSRCRRPEARAPWSVRLQSARGDAAGALWQAVHVEHAAVALLVEPKIERVEFLIRDGAKRPVPREEPIEIGDLGVELKGLALDDVLRFIRDLVDPRKDRLNRVRADLAPGDAERAFTKKMPQHDTRITGSACCGFKRAG